MVGSWLSLVAGGQVLKQGVNLNGQGTSVSQPGRHLVSAAVGLPCLPSTPGLPSMDIIPASCLLEHPEEEAFRPLEGAARRQKDGLFTYTHTVHLH